MMTIYDVGKCSAKDVGKGGRSVSDCVVMFPFRLRHVRPRLLRLHVQSSGIIPDCNERSVELYKDGGSNYFSSKQ